MTESMNQLNLARKAGKGGGGGSVTVIDNLNSTSTTAALSANQGRILGLSTTSLDMQLQDEEGTPFYFDKKEGKYGFNTDEERGSETFHAFGEGGGGSVTVIDNLDSTSSTDALSANMGHTLNTSLTTVSNNLSAYDMDTETYTETKFRYATQNGKYGYIVKVEGADTFFPFKSGGRIARLYNFASGVTSDKYFKLSTDIGTENLKVVGDSITVEVVVTYYEAEGTNRQVGVYKNGNLVDTLNSVTKTNLTIENMNNGDWLTFRHAGNTGNSVGFSVII